MLILNSVLLVGVGAFGLSISSSFVTANSKVDVNRAIQRESGIHLGSDVRRLDCLQQEESCQTSTLQSHVRGTDIEREVIDDDEVGSSPSFFISEEGTDDSKENLVDLPPSNKRRKWGLGFGLITLFALVILLYIYRHTLPSVSPLLTRISSITPTPIKSFFSRLFIPVFSHIHLPTITSSTFSLPFSKQPRSSPRFRPDSTSLLHWSEEEDPSFSQSTSNPNSSSSWRSKLPSFSSSTPKSKSRFNSNPKPKRSFFFNDIEEEEYEEVGLISNPANGYRYTNAIGYGSV